MSRGTDFGSRGGFFVSGFRYSGTGHEPEAVFAGLEDVTVVGEPVQPGGGQLGIAEHARPLAEAEAEVDGDGYAGAFVEFAEQV
jgi:hypothetical protein